MTNSKNIFKNYRIDIRTLPRLKVFAKKEKYGDQKAFLAPDKRHLIVQYDLSEIAMGWDIGYFAVFKVTRDTKKRIFSHAYSHCWEKEPIFLDGGRYAVISAYIYDKQTGYVSVPFLILDLKEYKLAYYLMMESFAYTVAQVRDKYILKGSYTGNKFKSHDNHELKLNKLIWVAFSRYGKYRRDYLAGKIGSPYADCPIISKKKV